MEKRRRDGNKFYKNFPVFVASSVPCFHDDREIRKNNKGFKDTKDWLVECQIVSDLNKLCQLRLGIIYYSLNEDLSRKIVTEVERTSFKKADQV